MLLLVIAGSPPVAMRILLYATIACSVIAARAASDAHPVFEPDIDAAQGLTLQGRTWSREDASLTIHLREVDQAERLNYIEGATGVRIDPFAAPAGSEPRFVTFLLVVENKGDVAVGFNALDSWLKTNRQEIQTPLGLTDLSFDYHTAGLELPAAYESISPVMLEGARTIIPGDSVSGLLVYRVVDSRTKRFHVEVDLIPPSGDVVRFNAPYRRSKPASN